jgi:hypothetical protein
MTPRPLYLPPIACDGRAVQPSSAVSNHGGGWMHGVGTDLTSKEDPMVAGATAAALVIGFLTGLLAFRAKSRWCPRCGSLTSVVPDGRHSEEVSACPPKR